MGASWKSFEEPGTESLNCLYQIGHKNLDFKDAADKVSKGSRG